MTKDREAEIVATAARSQSRCPSHTTAPVTRRAVKIDAEEPFVSQATHVQSSDAGMRGLARGLDPLLLHELIGGGFSPSSDTTAYATTFVKRKEKFVGSFRAISSC